MPVGRKAEQLDGGRRHRRGQAGNRRTGVPASGQHGGRQGDQADLRPPGHQRCATGHRASPLRPSNRGARGARSGRRRGRRSCSSGGSSRRRPAPGCRRRDRSVRSGPARNMWATPVPAGREITLPDSTGVSSLAQHQHAVPSRITNSSSSSEWQCWRSTPCPARPRRAGAGVDRARPRGPDSAGRAEPAGGPADPAVTSARLTIVLGREARLGRELRRAQLRLADELDRNPVDRSRAPRRRPGCRSATCPSRGKPQRLIVAGAGPKASTSSPARAAWRRVGAPSRRGRRCSRRRRPARSRPFCQETPRPAST